MSTKKGRKSRETDNSLEGWSRIIREDGERSRRARVEAEASAPLPIVWNPGPNPSPDIDMVQIKTIEGMPDNRIYSLQVTAMFRAEDLAAFGTFLVKTFGAK